MNPPNLSPQHRLSILEEQRHFKMAASVHAYVRGNTRKFYEWLESGNGRRIPQGPSVWICGDCHVGNLGPVANNEGKVEIQIRDLDQTVIGNPAHDLVRLALSLATAARSSDLPGITTAHMMENLIEGYLAGLSREPSLAKNAKSTDPVRIVLKQALNRHWRQLAEERIEDVRPAIPLGPRFWILTKKEKEEIDRIFKLKETRELVTCLRGRKSGEKVEVLDAAYWMKGCSSLGRLRYAVLLKTGKRSAQNHGLCIMDLKEAVKPAAPRDAKASIPRDNAQRVVAGARALSPFLGERMLATRFLDHSVVVRELLPQDLKIEMESITKEETVHAARFLAGVVAQAHARQMDAETRNRWKSELSNERSKTLAAPSWLWTSVVELIASHETAYLEHCRKYTMQTKGSRTS